MTYIQAHLHLLILLAGLWLDGWLAAELDPIRTLTGVTGFNLHVRLCWTHPIFRTTVILICWTLIGVGVFWSLARGAWLVAVLAVAIHLFLFRPAQINSRRSEDGYFQFVAIGVALAKHFKGFPETLQLAYAKSPDLPKLDQQQMLIQSFYMLEEPLVMRPVELVEMANSFGISSLDQVSPDFINAVAATGASRGATADLMNGCMTLLKPGNARPEIMKMISLPQEERKSRIEIICEGDDDEHHYHDD